MRNSANSASQDLQPPRTSIRRGLVVGSLVLILASFAICATSLYAMLYRPLLRDMIALDMRRASEKVAGDVANIFDRLGAIAMRNREWGKAGLIDLEDLRALNALIGPLFAANTSITSAAIARDTGHEILIYASSQGGWLNRLTDPDVWGREARFLTWSAHAELLQSEQREVAYDARQRPWFKGVMAQHDADAIYWTPPYKFVSTQEPGISAVVRWAGSDGHTYAMTTDITLLDLSRFTQQVSVGRSGLAAVLGDDGTMLAVPRDPRFADANAIHTALMQPVSDLRLAPLTAAFAAWQQSGRPGNAILRFEVGATPWLTMFNPIHLADRTFWAVTLAPAADFEDLSENAWVLGMVIVLASIALASLGAIWLGGLFATPIEQLTAESERIGEIDLQSPIAVRSRVREIDFLARSLEGMRVRLIQAREEREAKRALEKQLEEAQHLEELGRFAGGIAHDFNNVLGAMLGFASFLVEDLPPHSREHSYASRIVKAGQSAKDLVAQILAFARRGKVERKPLDLARLVRDSADLLRGTLPASTELTIAIEASDLIAEVNPAQLTQLLLNLCVNAKDAFAGKPGRITLSLAPAQRDDSDVALVRGASANTVALTSGAVAIGALDPQRDYARLTVADNGPGMDDAVLARIFEPFFTTKEGAGRGTGLGLAVVRGIVIAYEGACVVASRPGAGTRFSIYLPLRDRIDAVAPAGGEEASVG